MFEDLLMRCQVTPRFCLNFAVIACSNSVAISQEADKNKIDPGWGSAFKKHASLISTFQSRWGNILTCQQILTDCTEVRRIPGDHA